METIEIKPNTRLKAKGFDISIGKSEHQIALISHSSGDFASFKNIRKGGRLAKIKRIFKKNISSDTHFFFEFMQKEDVLKLLQILNK